MMDKKYVEQKIKEILVEKTNLNNIGEINNMAPVSDYLNSITFIQFLIAVEDTFDLDFDDEMLDAANFNDLNDILAELYKILDLA